MKHFLLLATLILWSAGTCRAQQSIHSENLDPFHTINLSGKLVVKLIPSESNTLDVELKETQSDRLEYGVSDGVLSVRLKPGSSSSGSADVEIHYKELQTLKIAGANVSVQDTLRNQVLDMDVSAGATLVATVKTMDLSLNVRGNSAANLSGEVKYYALTAGTRSKVNTLELSGLNVEVVASSGAEAYVSARERLLITAESGAAVYYRGDPVILRTTTKMMGTINSIGK